MFLPVNVQWRPDGLIHGRCMAIASRVSGQRSRNDRQLHSAATEAVDSTGDVVSHLMSTEVSLQRPYENASLFFGKVTPTHADRLFLLAIRPGQH